MNGFIIRDKHEIYYRNVLKRAKSSVKAYIFDYDGTIKSSSEPESLPLDLIKKIVLKNKFVGIITASGASALNGLAKQIIKLNFKNHFLNQIYLGVANGVALYKLDGFKKHELYSYPLTMNEANYILKAWQKAVRKNKLKDTDLTEKGLITFKEFLKKDWNGYISNERIKLSVKFSGKIFIEELKISLVMPKNQKFSQKRFIGIIQDEIDNLLGSGKFIVERGDTVFAHITHKPNMSPKLFALKKIMAELKLKNEEVAVFGDMPFDNDKGLLIDSHLPYTFTNRYFYKENIDLPPFILPKSELSPVGSVYKAVDYLLK